jgi:integrase
MIGLTTGMRDSEIGRIKREDIQYVKSEDAYILKVFNHKTDFYNKDETDEYRKIPLHPLVVKVLKKYIMEVEQTRKIEKTDYLFGVPKLDEETGIIDGYLHFRKPRKAIVELYRRIKIKERFEETGEIEKSLFIDTKELEKEMKEKRIVFYSCRHTFNTLLGMFMNIQNNNDLIDYFLGHKISNEMRANYTQINRVDNKTFLNDYGSIVIDMLNKYIFISEDEKEKKKNFIKEYVDAKFEENKDLIKDGEISSEDALEKIIRPMLNEVSKKSNINNEDDFFMNV